MQEHEMLKEICDVIGYESKFWNTDVNPNWFYKWYSDEVEDINVREIIFTQKFMDKYFMGLYNKGIRTTQLEVQHIIILRELDNIVIHLYKTLWLWTK